MATARPRRWRLHAATEVAAAATTTTTAAAADSAHHSLDLWLDAAVFSEYLQAVHVTEVPETTLLQRFGAVAVRMAASGLCLLRSRRTRGGSGSGLCASNVELRWQWP